MNRLAKFILRWLLPAALLLAQHGVWAHGLAHDLAKVAGQSQNDVRHDCCLPFQASGDAACAALPQPAAAPLAADAAHSALLSGCSARPVVPYASRAPPHRS